MVNEEFTFGEMVDIYSAFVIKILMNKEVVAKT